MKRCIDTLVEEADRMSPAELAHVGKELTRLYSASAQAYTELFFSQGLDVFVAHILTPLSHSQPLADLVSLSRVCKLWHRLIHRVTHVNLDSSMCFTLAYTTFWRSFPLVCSLRSHRKVLSPLVNGRCCHIKHLEIEPQRGDDTRSIEFDVSQWPALETFRFRSVSSYVKGLRQLTNLTHLEINDCAFRRDVPDLSPLINLRHLWMRGLSPLIDLTALTQLCYLNSDRAAHFRHYSGAGKLKIEDAPCEDDPEVEHAALKMYDNNRSLAWCRFAGEWKNGVFCGSARFHFGEQRNAYYEGEMRESKRNGTGTEEFTSGPSSDWTIYVGEWKNGLRHGIGRIYTLKAVQCASEKKLSSTGRWENGQLLETFCRESPVTC